MAFQIINSVKGHQKGSLTAIGARLGNLLANPRRCQAMVESFSFVEMPGVSNYRANPGLRALAVSQVTQASLFDLFLRVGPPSHSPRGPGFVVAVLANRLAVFLAGRPVEIKE
jgi:hypothetical protein